jgi:hypothetical protein
VDTSGAADIKPVPAPLPPRTPAPPPLLPLSAVCGCAVTAGHAVKHFEETGHTFSLNVAQQKVWDYVSDGYVHRLVLNKKDGQLVEVGGAGGGGGGSGGGGSGEPHHHMFAEAAVAEAAAVQRGRADGGGGAGQSRANLTALNPFEHYTSLKMEQVCVSVFEVAKARATHTSLRLIFWL